MFSFLGSWIVKNDATQHREDNGHLKFEFLKVEWLRNKKAVNCKLQIFLSLNKWIVRELRFQTILILFLVRNYLYQPNDFQDFYVKFVIMYSDLFSYFCYDNVIFM